MNTASACGLPCPELQALLAGLEAAQDLDDIRAWAPGLRAFQRRLIGVGLEGQLATRLISGLNDRLTVAVIERVSRRHRLPPVAWCWLALGSEGRGEQTLISDQDNGLVFAAVDGREAEALRPLFLPFAQDVNRQLAACGFSLCSGEVMAGNSRWCLSWEEWRQQFIDWVRLPEPEALLNASIFFDLRPLYGDLALGERLCGEVAGLARDASAFLHLMAMNALQAEPPLNFRSELVVPDNGGLDLKKFGARIFVDAARIFSLASGLALVHTGERLHAAGALAGLQPGELAAVDAAFSHILRLRLEHQAGCRTPDAADSNVICLDDLNEFDRVILREAMRQARRLQYRLKINYSL